jgi:hypothetical protein
MKILFSFIVFSFLMMNCSTTKNTAINISIGTTDPYLVNLMKQHAPLFDSVLSNIDQNRLQIIYTQIDRRKNGKPKFTDHYFNVNDSDYFYPASTVKLPVAILALQKLNELKIAGLDKNSLMISEAAYSGQSEVYNDPSAPDGRPTIAHYIKKILLVSDNDAFNRLYEFLGQEYINNSLHKMGYKEVQIIHRLEISLTEEENRNTNPIKFFDTSGNIIYEKQHKQSKLVYAKRNTKMGQGFYRGDKLIGEPFDFSKKNRLSLNALHSIVRSVMFPTSVSKKQRFNLTNDDLDFLRRYMSMMPHESGIPLYETDEYWDTYVKFLYYGSEKNVSKSNTRIFNKVGDAYGFLIDVAYFADFDNNIEFQLSAMIHCNSDGIFNDNNYDYNSIGFPFMKQLGQLIYEHELKRDRKTIPDLTGFRFNYTQ